MDERLKKIMEERAAVYGDFGADMRTTAQAWSAMLERGGFYGTKDDLPSWMVPLMMATLKILRASTGNYHADNFDDAHNYLEIAQKLQREEM